MKGILKHELQHLSQRGGGIFEIALKKRDLQLSLGDTKQRQMFETCQVAIAIFVQKINFAPHFFSVTASKLYQLPPTWMRLVNYNRYCKIQ